MAMISSVLIVGGGATGWMAAAYLSQFLPRLKLTVMEAPDVPPLVVGESTNTITSRFNQAIGLEETSFLRVVQGTYKIAIRFEGFSKLGDVFHHPFGRPVREVSFNPRAEDYYPTTHLCRAGKFDPKLNVHGYHVDTGGYSTALRKLATARGVKHIQRRIERIDCVENNIRSVEGEVADLYIDCTGFARLLLGKGLREPFESLDQVLLNDSAIAMRLPYRNKERELDPVTRCVAMRYGWVWLIPLWSRLGVGYCYSSKFVKAETAEQELRDYLSGHEVARIDATHIPIRHGRFRRQWVGNCVALGVAGGFIEPLESTGISLTQANLMHLTVAMNEPELWTRAANRRFDTTVDFIQAHYNLTKRRDTEYWRTVSSLPRTPGLSRVLEGVAARSYAVIEDDPHAFYRVSNWNVILAGMGLFNGANMDAPRLRVPDVGTHYEYLRSQIYETGTRP